MHRTSRSMCTLLGICLMVACARQPAPPAELQTAASSLLTQVADDVWAHQLERDPWAQLKYGVEIRDLPRLSLAETEAEVAFARSTLDRLEDLDEADLDDEERVTLAILRWSATETIELARFHWLNFPITPYASMLSTVHRIFTEFRFEKPEDTDRYLDLLSRYPDVVGEIHDHVASQVERGIIVTEPELVLVLPFLKGFIQEPAENQFSVSEERLKEIDAETARGFRSRVQEAITERINPALQRLYDYVAGPYRERAPERVGLWQYPGGSDYYRALVKSHTTLDVSPEEIHQIGLDAVERINASMAELRKKIGFEGSKAEFHHFLKTDPRFFAKTPEEVRQKLLSFAEGIDSEVDALFLKRPKAPHDVQRLDPALEGAWTYGYYQEPTATNPKGIYFFNGSDLSERSLIGAESLIYHELIPGHHFQIAFQEENQELSILRKNYYNSAYTEGWAEYSSALGFELGRYQDPYDRYGRYADELYLAVRLVVDTGMNHLRWTRARATAYMRENLLSSDTENATETLRYCCDVPGQALGYRMGAREIHRLRGRAAEALGNDFDVRRFHQAVIGSGAMPLEVLGERIDRFIARERNHR